MYSYVAMWRVLISVGWNMTCLDGQEIAGTLDKVVKVKVKCTLVQAMRLCTGRMACRGVEV
jgi:hypothetical protein